MTIDDVVTEVEVEWRESQNQRDKRVEELWRKLDPQGTGELDLRGLQRGLRKIDHPMKNADDMLKEIVKMVDKNGDGKIQFAEFRTFMEAAERQLLLLFKSIDRDHDGKLNRDELCAAFGRSGIAVPSRRLNGFFDEIDMNNDGYISFDEWRDFLLFMPHDGGSPLAAALSFYSSIATLNAEGDSMVSEETLEGLGLPISEREATERMAGMYQSHTAMHEGTSSRTETITESDQDWGDIHDHPLDFLKTEQTAKFRLTQYLPEPGYFVAGALAGGISRTATAPFDRLKVYLLVNTKAVTNKSLDAAKHGHPLVALQKASRPISSAVMDLWKTGGFRTFFAGNGLNVVKIMPETAIKFGSYEAAKRTLANLEGHGDPTDINPYSKFVAGGVAGMIAQFCVYPLDTLKFRLQCETVEGGLTGNALIVQTAKKMYAIGGVRTAYRGVTMGLVGMFPYSAIDMGTFEFLKNTFTRYKARYYGIHEEDAKPGNLVTGVIGATSGAFGATVVYPLNVLRTRLQTQGTVMHPPTYTGIWDVATRTIRNEGVRGMYKGLTPNLLKVAPALSITWVVYENSKKFLSLH
ncbi:hypothetical protein NKR23_g10637 [Pleurostoma richardsiae]|uniref:Mitochondrial thiamine pyrophosphate carrier 1 n=1 Tax=Pleurostoma richardsiae TaxID=41990 RepID=A0AA38RCH6_9PEZI|nr:hypothetical protein NKR23_g10637 [Pleurostoma richardsiae]